MKRDDAASLPILVLRRGDVDVAVAADGEMAYRAEPFRDDAGVKTGRQRQTIGFWGGRKCHRRRRNQNRTKRFHAVLSSGISILADRPAPLYTEALRVGPVSYTHLRAHETRHDLVC